MDIVSAGIDRLTFRQVAREWAKEVGSKPGSFDEKKIFDTLVNAFLHGQFDDFELTIERAPKYVLGKRIQPPPMRVTRASFANIIVLAPGSQISLPAKQADPNDPSLPKYRPVDSVPWEELAKQGPNAFDKHLREAWLEPLTIRKDNLARWADRQDYKQPRFWFGDVRGEAHTGFGGESAESAGKRGGQQPKYDVALQDAINRIARQLQDAGTPITPGNFKGWFVEKDAITKPRLNFPKPWSFEQPIGNCDELYIDGKKLVWKNRDGIEKDMKLRSLEPYFKRAKAFLLQHSP